jgi:2-keto-4-pentenoate hydratase/2-oxohepta-3-ene-1,7-dioic acid hydratase in catechol pathway
MRWCRFETENGPSFGIVEGDRIVPVDGDPFAGYQARKTHVPLEGTRLLPPVDNPSYYAIGRNYQGHIEGRARAGSGKPKEAWAWWRSPSALTGHDSDVVIPADCPDDVEYECEPVVVLKKGGKNLSRKEAADAILGFTIGNDVTGMSWERRDPSSWRSKSCDTWKPLGPWIETDLNVEAAVCTVRYNGVPQVRWNISRWMFSPVDVLCKISRYMTLEPGDILTLGAEGMSPYLQHGDIVEAEITGLGMLRNRFVREGMPTPAR